MSRNPEPISWDPRYRDNSLKGRLLSFRKREEGRTSRHETTWSLPSPLGCFLWLCINTKSLQFGILIECPTTDLRHEKVSNDLHLVYKFSLVYNSAETKQFLKTKRHSSLSNPIFWLVLYSKCFLNYWQLLLLSCLFILSPLRSLSSDTFPLRFSTFSFPKRKLTNVHVGLSRHGTTTPITITHS